MQIALELATNSIQITTHVVIADNCILGLWVALWNITTIHIKDFHRYYIQKVR